MKTTKLKLPKEFYVGLFNSEGDEVGGPGYERVFFSGDRRKNHSVVFPVGIAAWETVWGFLIFHTKEGGTPMHVVQTYQPIAVTNGIVISLDLRSLRRVHR